MQPRLPSRNQTAGKATNPSNPEKNGHPKSRTGRPKTLESESRADYLKNVATDVFIEYGYERASLSEIAKRAGASKETLYSQYADKSDLFVAVMSSHLQTAFAPFLTLIVGHQPLQKGLRDFAFQLLTAMLGPYQAFVHLIFCGIATLP